MSGADLDLTEEQVLEFKEAFHLFDKDGDGKITIKVITHYIFNSRDVSHNKIMDIHEDVFIHCKKLRDM